ncbi:hypothetical protein [Alkalicoccus chagannorensis]|uniref:hypothetical protein n=1 Tax=Alkalicoccus chagannorensis TaxID=427072 RepID=UPI00047E8D9F|nr:hypothetical protein [Alkalicoccus chagannorensis]
MDFSSSNQTTMQTFDQQFGDKSIQMSDGTSVNATENMQGGYDFSKDGQKIAYTTPNQLGGVNVFDPSTHAKTGYSTNTGEQLKMFHSDHSNAGDLSYLSDGSIIANEQGEIVASTQSTGYGLQTVMHYEDPLAHAQTFMMPPFQSLA